MLKLNSHHIQPTTYPFQKKCLTKVIRNFKKKKKKKKKKNILILKVISISGKSTFSKTHNIFFSFFLSFFLDR